MEAELRELVRRLELRVTELEDQLRQRDALIDQLRDENDRLRKENQLLRQRLEDLERSAARQAAPFRRRPATKIPHDQKKRPGRKKGHPGTQRAIPEQVDEHVEVPLTQCPNCAGPVADLVPIERYIEEIVPARPRVTKLVTFQGCCARCGDVFSSHPLQTAPGLGGSKVQIGPRALAIAALLNKQHGLPMRRTCAVLQGLVGLQLTPGGLSQALGRAAAKVKPEYQRLVETVRNSPAVFVDETSWWVGEPSWWLWTFTTDTATVYVVEKSRGSQVVHDTLGGNFAGMLVSDCLSSYDPPAYRKHKCIAHHLQAIKTAQERADTIDPRYLGEWKIVFTLVRGIWHTRSKQTEVEFALRKAKLREWVDRLLAKPVVQPGDVAVRNRLEKHRDHLLGCLDEPAAEPTNNRAERALRPAVIARKVSCGNRTEVGKECWQILVSLAETCRTTGRDFVDWLTPRISARCTAT